MAKKFSRKKYDYHDLKKEREFGFYWYSLVWRLIRPLLIFLISTIATIGIVGIAYTYFDSNYISAINLNDSSNIIFTVNTGSSLSKVSKDLENQNLIKNSHIFKYYCDFIGLGQKIQSGEYTLKRNMNINQIANALSSGDGKPITNRLTIIPGQGIEDIATKLFNENIISDKQEFLNLCKDAKEFANYYFIDDLIKTANTASRKYLLEGYLAADTYELYTNTSTKQIITKLLTQMDNVFSANYHDRAKEVGMTMDQVVTLASIIEKESKTNDFTKVSAVFHNRLKKGMKLQSDVTVHYTTNIRRMLLNKNDIETKSPYNTYLVKGLPIGPICSPSPNAIYAALFPDSQYVEDEYLYFCSKNPETGELYFSKTLQEHEQAVTIYAPLWKAFDENRGIADDK